MDEILCELCGEKSDVDFNCLLYVPEHRGGGTTLVQANICLDCLSRYSNDYIVAIAILRQRDDVYNIKGKPK